MGQAESRRARTHRRQMSSGGPRERAPCERALRHARSLGRWLDEDPHWPDPRLACTMVGGIAGFPPSSEPRRVSGGWRLLPRRHSPGACAPRAALGLELRPVRAGAVQWCAAPLVASAVVRARVTSSWRRASLRSLRHGPAAIDASHRLRRRCVLPPYPSPPQPSPLSRHPRLSPLVSALAPPCVHLPHLRRAPPGL